MDNFKFATELKARTDARAKAEASKIKPKMGTSVRFQKYSIEASRDIVTKLKEEALPKISANNERFAKKFADVENAPIQNELDANIKAIKENVRNRFNNNIDARIAQNNKARIAPIRQSSKELLQTIDMLIKTDADIKEDDWKAWGEQFAGHYLEEIAYAGYAKQKGIDVIPSSNPDKSNERLESFRKIGNIAIDFLDHPEDSIMAQSFFSENPDSPVSKLMEEIDSDLATIIPAEKITVLQRLKDAKENAYNKNNVMLAVKIGSFIRDNMDKLATPEEISETLFAEAEEFIEKGMSAEKGNE